MSDIRLSGSRSVPKDFFMARLNDYNTYYDDGSEQLRKRMTKNGDLVIEGLLNIYWGLKTAIRLQVADESVKIRPKTIEKGGSSERNSLVISGQTVDLDNAIWGETRRQRKSANRLVVPGQSKDDTDVSESLLRTNSVIMRKKGVRNLRHRASINGHAYNHKTSVFTPAFGSVTKVRVSSQNNANDVITKLLNKFRVENPADEFSFYVVKETQERREMPRDEIPILSRVLIGPNEKLGKIFLMEKKMHQEIPLEVAQYIKLDVGILQMFLKKFHEEEEREVKKMRKRYEFYRKMLKKQINEAKS
ncbi:ras association domain-containing protein 2-like [Clavelina lepadiformis]|uniref:Ras association domain-containing protein 2 n=1 Tax=Clavelina lepadiformis TaxID=159417 RepID=A0ABP0EYL4_CLALP